MKIFVNVIALLCAVHSGFGEEVRLLNLDPPEAQQYIDKQDTSLKYAPKIETNVPAVRFLGNEPHNVVEDIYLANQYHGQDGLGGYLYGYSVPDIAKTEKKKADGDLTGAYNYIAGDGQEIKVQYWDDGTGFHQVDNVPKILPKQIDDTPEVKAAKEEHQRIWNEQAERNSRPIENPFDSHFNYAQGPLSPQGQSQAQLLANQYQQQKHQFPNPGQNVQYQGDQYAQYKSQPTQNVNKYQQPGGQYGVGGGSQGASGPYGAGGQGGGQIGGSVQYGGGQPASGQYGGGQASSGQLGGGQASSGQYGGGQSGSGQFGGSSGHPSSSGQYTGSQSSSSGQFGGGQSGGGHPSGSGQYTGSQSSSGGQFGAGPSSLGGPFGGSQSSSGGQYGSSGKPSGSGQLGGGSSGSGQYGGGQASLGGPFGGGQSSGGQYGEGQASGSGQYGGGQPSGAGQYGGSQSSGGQSSSSGGYSSGSGQYSGNYGASSQYSTQYSSGQQSSGQYQGRDEGKWNDEEEEKGPPKGFFYSFDYPVGIIVQKDGAPIQKREGDLKDIYSANKANFEKQVQQGSGSSSGYLIA